MILALAIAASMPINMLAKYNNNEEITLDEDGIYKIEVSSFAQLKEALAFAAENPKAPVNIYMVSSITVNEAIVIPENAWFLSGLNIAGNILNNVVLETDGQGNTLLITIYGAFHIYGTFRYNQNQIKVSAPGKGIVHPGCTLQGGQQLVNEPYWIDARNLWQIVFHANGGYYSDGRNETHDYAERTNVLAKPPTEEPKRAGYSFTGWFKTPAGAEKWDFLTDRVNASTTIYAQWKIDDNQRLDYVVEYYYDGAKDEAMTENLSVQVLSPTVNSVPLAGKEKANYKLATNPYTPNLPTVITMENKVIRVDYIAEVNIYTVRFVDWDNSVIKSEEVTQGGSATAPENPTRTGYMFIGWDAEYSNVTSDLTVTALYAISTYTVRFLDWDDEELKIEEVDYGESATAPEDPTRTGYTFTGWDTEYSIIMSDLTVTALYTINTYTVKFVDWDDEELKIEIVPYGESATAPEDPTRAGYTFTGWDTDYSQIIRDLTVTALYTSNTHTYTVIFVDWDESVIKSEEVAQGESATAPEVPNRPGYTFIGWDAEYSNVTSNQTMTALYTINTYIVKFVDWNNDELKTETVPHGGSATAPTNPNRLGYTFTSWDTDYSNITGNLTVTAQYSQNINEPITINSGGGSGKIDIDIPDEATPVTNIPDKENLQFDYLEMDNHLIYINGYPDSTVQADRSITRAEVAAIYYRLLRDTYKSGNSVSTFIDVPNNSWYSQAVAKLAEMGMLKGYSDGTFRPNDPISRAEFATIAARFDKLQPVKGITFIDVPSNHWAAENISSAFAKGWINGYSDGTYRPNRNITRAEVAKIINTMLNRLPVELPELFQNPYIDIEKEHWAFIHIMEASTFHESGRDENGKEFWTMHICPITGEELWHAPKPGTEPTETENNK